MNTLSLGHDYVVAKVDKLVTDILSPNTRINIQQISEQLNIYYQAMTSLYNDELQYTASIEWFIGSCYLVCGNCYPSELIWDKAMTKKFIDTLSCYKHDFAMEISNFALREQRNSYSLRQYMNYCLEYARVLIVRVDLKIRLEFAHLVGIENFSDFLVQLMDKIQRDRARANRKKNTNRTVKDKGCFEDLRGYIWAIEQGVDTGGLHCHMLLIYNGDKRQLDWFLGYAIGKKWIEITDGLGCYFNCNTTHHKRDYKRQDKLGIGMIRKSNQLEVDNAINAALYLTCPEKYEQRLKAKLLGMRSFGHGQYHNTKRRGLPPIPK
ncbi:YagK/YfjJ domain-containing protein [Psychrobacter sp. AOP30-A2-5]|uniref:YagK/YfjJ domain-containing protein n=1 Tax=Psychrobacter sp. AOP30-A2-5 TaxID=3457697 RepID=UPI004036E83C